MHKSTERSERGVRTAGQPASVCSPTAKHAAASALSLARRYSTDLELPERGTSPPAVALLQECMSFHTAHTKFTLMNALPSFNVRNFDC